jgi:pSer/pThr/pTyr-binding forkhead associated (FHA) protein
MVDHQSKLTLVNINKAELAKGRHVLIVESPESRRAVSLNANVFSIGRHPNNDLVISDSLASRHHATVAWMRYTEGSKSDYSYWIIDGKGKRKRSRNGVFVNGVKKTLHRLTSGDLVSLGNNIKISYSYIPYSTDNSQFLNYCDRGGANNEYQPLIRKDKSLKETVIEDMAIIEETIIKE